MGTGERRHPYRRVQPGDLRRGLDRRRDPTGSLLESDRERVEPHPAKLGFWQRRRRAKDAERIRKEAEQDQRDAARIDELLDKIQRLGKVSLSADETAFLERMSLRYRDRS